MIPQNFIKEYKRMCKAYKKDESTYGYGKSCDGNCPLFNTRHQPHLIVDFSNPELFSEIYTKVEEWSNIHPLKTRQNEFLKIFPNAKLQTGIIDICPGDYERNLLNKEFCCPTKTACAKCRKDYWLASIEKEEDK